MRIGAGLLLVGAVAGLCGAWARRRRRWERSFRNAVVAVAPGHRRLGTMRAHLAQAENPDEFAGGGGGPDG